MISENGDRPNLQTGGMVISRTLRQFGINTTFALAGASHTFLLDALDRDDFKIILGRHETGTVGAADGFARVTRKVGVALIVSDQGIPNAITGILTAYEACSPVIVICVRRITTSIENQTLLDNEKLELVRPITKWARTIYSSERLAEYLETAYRYATSGRPGPVVLQVPQEFLRMPVTEIATIDEQKLVIAKPTVPVKLAEDAAVLLASAARPLVIAGSGSYWSDAGPELRTLSSHYSIPVFGNAMGRGLVREDEKLGWPWALAQSAARFSDVVLWVGARMTQRLGYGLAPLFNTEAKFIQIDIEGEELGRNRHIHLPIVADAKFGLEAMLDVMKSRTLRKKPLPTWVNAALKENKNFMDSIGQDNKSPIHPYKIARELMKQMPKNAIYIGDGADIQNWMHAYLRINCDGGYIDHYPLGSMGIGTPLAIGAAAGAAELAQKSGGKTRPIVHVTGDGAFGFYPSEYNGAVLSGFNITTIISNDGAWGTEKHGQRLAIGRDVNTDFGDVNYALIAQAFGCQAEKIRSPKEVSAAIRKALDHNGPAIIDVVTDPEAGALRKTDSRVQTVKFFDFSESRKIQSKKK